MGVHSTYTIFVKTNGNAISKMADAFDKAFGSEQQSSVDAFRSSATEANDPVNVGLSINDTYQVVYVEDITELVKTLAQIENDSWIVAEGSVDSSELGGEYMDFEIQYADGEIEEKTTEWYCDLDAEQFDYEDFCDEFGDYSEEQYEEFCRYPHYLLENSNEIVKETYMTEVKRIKV